MLSRQPVYSGIKNLILQFPNSFHILCTLLFTVYFHTGLSTFHFLFNWSHLKVGAVPSSDSSLFRNRSIIGQLKTHSQVWKKF